jgi:predicted Zn-dependent peptidase
MNSILNEEYGGLSDKVKEVKDFLDKNFIPDTITMTVDGKVSNVEVVDWIDGKNQVAKQLTDEQLFYLLQEEFNDILADEKERDEFLIKVIKNWYYKKIGKNYTLTDF